MWPARLVCDNDTVPTVYYKVQCQQRDMDSTVYAEQRYKDGLECARRATQYDHEGHLSAALSFYSESVEALNQACSMNPVFSPILPRVAEYARRAEEIRVHCHSTGGKKVDHLYT